MLLRRRDEDVFPETLDAPPFVLARIINALQPSNEAALHAAARLLAASPGVCGAMVEVFPERSGRPSIIAGDRVTLRARSDDEVLRIDLRDHHDRVVGALSVAFDDPDFVAPTVMSLCETAAVLMSGTAARMRLEATLLDAQSYEVAGQIAAGLVHDFNNMLTGILGHASVAQMMVEVDSPAVGSLQRIGEAASSAAQLSRALLNFVRGSTQREALGLNEVVTGVRRVMSRAIRDGIAVHLDLAPDIPMVEGERSLIQQALVNLTMNAVDAIAGEGSITIRTRWIATAPVTRTGLSASTGGYVTLSVQDTGSGIAPEHLDEIFRPFFSTKGRGGTGLGLPSVVQVARRHGGEVGVESRVGFGTTFTVYLPAAGTSVSLLEVPFSAPVRLDRQS